MQFHCKEPFFRKKKEGCMRSQMQKQKAACEAKCSFNGTGKKGVMSIRKDNWLITPIDNQLYFFWNDSITLSLISPFVGRRFQELENCNSAVREIVLAAPCQHAFYLFSCGTCQMFGVPACNAKPAAIYYLRYFFI